MGFHINEIGSGWRNSNTNSRFPHNLETFLKFKYKFVVENTVRISTGYHVRHTPKTRGLKIETKGNRKGLHSTTMNL